MNFEQYKKQVKSLEEIKQSLTEAYIHSHTDLRVGMVVEGEDFAGTCDIPDKIRYYGKIIGLGVNQSTGFIFANIEGYDTQPCTLKLKQVIFRERG